MLIVICHLHWPHIERSPVQRCLGSTSLPVMRIRLQFIFNSSYPAKISDGTNLTLLKTCQLAS
jgi:hypothetical protein